jgi:hypothetical protein
VKDLDLAYEDLLAAAGVCKRYSIAVEKKLYMNMSVNEAYAAIKEAERLACLLEEAAARIDTVSPVDLG